MSNLIFKSNEWTFPAMERVLEEAAKIGQEELGAKLGRNKIEVITADQMLENYVSHGLPIHYHHWSFGRSFLQQKQAYDGGQMGLAYEIVVNTDPVIAYCMENNSMAMQTLVIAHASIGHHDFFRNNYLFQHWTDPEAVIDYLIFARDYIKKCEERYGIDEVEELLDSAHALRYQSFDFRKRAQPLTEAQEQERQHKLMEALESERSEFDDLIAKPKDGEAAEHDRGVLKEPEENILYFLEKNSQILKPWQREILRIVRTIQQYFYPQMQTQIGNEGWATFTHHYILNRMYDKGLITEGALLECMTSHSGVTYQQEMSPNFNPYALGFAIYTDIKRMCENPTDEDREWFPNLVGKNWVEECRFAMENFRDESFIEQYLSPKVMRDFRMFMINDDASKMNYEVSAIHNEAGYRKVRKQLAEAQRLENKVPQLRVIKADMRGDRKLVIEHQAYGGVVLDEKSLNPVIQHIAHLWGYNVVIRSVQDGAELCETEVEVEETK